MGHNQEPILRLVRSLSTRDAPLRILHRHKGVQTWGVEPLLPPPRAKACSDATLHLFRGSTMEIGRLPDWAGEKGVRSLPCP